MPLILSFLVCNERLIIEATSWGCNEDGINLYIKSMFALSNWQLLLIIFFLVVIKKHLLKSHSLCAFYSMRSWCMNWKKRDTYVFRVRSGCRRWHWSLSATEFRCVASSSSSPGMVLNWAAWFRRGIPSCTQSPQVEYPLWKHLLNLRS